MICPKFQIPVRTYSLRVNSKFYSSKARKGFTLIELLVVMSITAILAAAGTISYYGAMKKDQLDSHSKEIMSDLIAARTKAINQEGNNVWGVRFESNNNSALSKYFIFEGPTAGGVILNSNTLGNNINFTSPTPASPSTVNEIVFNKLTGNPKDGLGHLIQISVAPAISGLIAQWGLNEGNGTTTYDGVGTNNGTLLNGPIWQSGTNCVSGECLSFDGINDYVNIGNLGSFYPQGTIEFWMNPAVVENYRNPFTTNYLGGNDAIRFEEYTTAGSWGGFGAFIGNSGGGGTDHIYLPSTVLQINTWYHVALSWNTSLNMVTGYLNGVQKFNEANTTWPTTLYNLAIGNGYDSTRYWKGSIDDVRIYNRALSASEVSSIYDRTLTKNIYVSSNGLITQ